MHSDIEYKSYTIRAVHAQQDLENCVIWQNHLLIKLKYPNMWLFSDEKNSCPLWCPRDCKQWWPCHANQFLLKRVSGSISLFIPNVLDMVVNHWIEGVSLGRQYVFQKDTAPSNMNKDWLDKNFHNHALHHQHDAFSLIWILWTATTEKWETNKWPNNTKDKNYLTWACSCFQWYIMIDKIISIKVIKSILDTISKYYLARAW